MAGRGGSGVGGADAVRLKKQMQCSTDSAYRRALTREITVHTMELNIHNKLN